MLGAMDDERTFEVKVAELLEHLKINRNEHAAIVEEAQAGFRKACVEKLDEMLAAAHAGKTVSMHLGLTVPTAHIDHFDNAIGLLEMTQRAGTEKVEITSTEYKNYVQNVWSWSNQFLMSNSGYSKRL